MNYFPVVELWFRAASCAVRRYPRSFSQIAAACILLFVILASSARAQIYEYGIPSGGARPQSIVTGPDGALWFTEFNTSRIGRVDTNANVTEPFYFNNGSNSFPFRIVVGPDTNLWFTETAADKIARISPGTNGGFTNGVFTEFPLHPGVNTNSQPAGLTVGPDGNLWFLEFEPNIIGVMDTNGNLLHEYTSSYFSNSTELYNITTGPDGAMWFTDFSNRSIGRIDTSGNITIIDLPFILCQPMDIITGPDGAMWFSEYNSNRIGRLTVTNGYPPGRYPATNNYSDFLIPSQGTGGNNYSQLPYRLTVGPDSNVWFTEFGAGNIGRVLLTATNYVATNINTSNVIQEFFTPTGGSVPTGITTGPDQNIWFVEYANAVARFILPTLTITLNTNSPQYTVTWTSLATDYTLQGNTNLSTTNWTNITSPINNISNMFVYTNSTTNLEFFRLVLTSIP